MTRILIIEAEASTRQLLAYDLGAAGHEVITAGNAADGLQMARETQPDLILSELNLPDGSGTDVCGVLRQEAGIGDALFMILSAQGDEIDRVRAFENGVDDYLTKPFSPRELVLRIRAMLRRSLASRSASTITNIGCLRLDTAAYRVWVDGQDVHLTTTEFQILLALHENFGRVLTRERLIESLWNDGEIDIRTVDAHVRRLRLRLGAAANYIKTVRGVGYRLSYERAVQAAGRA